MKKLASTAMIIGALACSVFSSSASAAPQPSKRSHAVNLPTQFAVKTWKVDECEGIASYFGTGLYAADAIDIEEDGGKLRIHIGDISNRRPDPRELHNAALALIGPQNGASENVLKQSEVQALCAAYPHQFEDVFWKLLVDHNFGLTYLAGVDVLHEKESALIIFLPYALAAGQPAQFIMAVIPRGHHVHDETRLSTLSPEAVAAIIKKKKSHNGIVHGTP